MMLETLIICIFSYWLRLVFVNMAEIGILLRNGLEIWVETKSIIF
jgi:hypothetical protein